MGLFICHCILVVFLQVHIVCLQCLASLQYVYSALQVYSMFTVPCKSTVCVQCLASPKYSVLQVYSMCTVSCKSKVQCLASLQYAYSVFASPQYLYTVLQVYSMCTVSCKSKVQCLASPHSLFTVSCKSTEGLQCLASPWYPCKSKYRTPAVSSSNFIL